MGYGNNIEHDAKAMRYRVRLVIHGKVYKKTFRYRAKEEQPAARLRAFEYVRQLDAVRDGRGVEDLPAAGMTLLVASTRYLEDLARSGAPATTCSFYKFKHEVIRRVFGDGARIDWITRKDVERYIERRTDDKVSTGTIKKELTALGTLQRHFDVKPGWLMPKALLRHKPKRRRVMPMSEVVKLWSVLPVEARIAVGLCLFAGFRAEEAYRAQASWCNFDAGEIYLPEEGTKKDEPNRTALVGTLAALLPREGVLVSVSRQVIRAHLEKASSDLGLSVHVGGPGLFRHVCATTLGELGYADREIALVLSHAYGTMRDRYIHSQAVEKKRTMLEAVEREFLKAQNGETSRNEPGTLRVLRGSRSVQNGPGDVVGHSTATA